MTRELFGLLYFAVQRVRGGVDKRMIGEAGRLLDSPIEVVRQRALERLASISRTPLTWDDFGQLPLVDRKSLVAAASAATRRRETGEFELRRTSGSTGTPFFFPKDKVMTAWMDATMWAVYAWHGITPGMPHARFWGRPLDLKGRLKKTVADRFLNRRRIGAFDLSSSNVRGQFRTLLRLGPSYGYGYPTLMRRFAELARDDGLDGRELRLALVISTGEILTPSAREELTAFFGCPVIDEYGCTESGVVGFECEHGRMHAVPVAAWPEIVGPSGRPLPEGTEGEVVISDLFGRVMPLRRYRLHDRGRIRQVSCSCARDLPILEIRSGRSDSFIETPAGKVYDAILAYTVPRGIQRFRVYQVTADHLDAEIVPGTGFVEDKTAAECKENWEKVLGPGMCVSVRTVTDIPSEPSGKLRYFVPRSEAAS